MSGNIYMYILCMAATTFFIRVIPMTVIRKPIKSRFIKSFLYYVPYVTLAVMTVPAIYEVTNSPLAGLISLVVGIVAAWLGQSLLSVSVICCLCVFVIELLL